MVKASKSKSAKEERLERYQGVLDSLEEELDEKAGETLVLEKEIRHVKGEMEKLR